MNNIRSIELRNKQNIFITSTILDYCNLKCPYCFNAQYRKNLVLDLDGFHKFLERLRTKTNRHMNVVLIGGEPSCHPNLLEFCRKCQTIENFEINICTNLSLDIDLYHKLIKTGSNLVVSWHSLPEDQINRDFIHKLKRLKDLVNDISQLEVLIMAEPDNFEISNMVFGMIRNIFKENLPIIEFNMVRSTNQYNSKYSGEDFSRYKTVKVENNDYNVTYEDGKTQILQINDSIEKDRFKFTGWICDSGCSNLYVHDNGYVYRCWSYCHNGLDPICSIYDESFHINSSGYECKAEECGLDGCYTSKIKV